MALPEPALHPVPLSRIFQKSTPPPPNFIAETVTLESKAVLLPLKCQGLAHVGQRHVSAVSGRLGHCLGLHLIPTATVVTVLTPFPHPRPGHTGEQRRRSGNLDDAFKDLKIFAWQDSLT